MQLLCIDEAPKAQAEGRRLTPRALQAILLMNLEHACSLTCIAICSEEDADNHLI